jgi:3-oxoacyl-[acyl-carrier protein] reductase
MHFGFKGKTVLVTGGSSGIGRATVLALAQEPDVNIAFTYFNNEGGARELVQSIEAEGGLATAVHLDLANHASIEQAVTAVATRFGQIDVLVNNAVHWGRGANRGKPFEAMPLTQWEETIGVNLFGTVKVTQAVVPFMRQQKWGRIVNVSSDLAVDSMVGSGPYSTLKSALFGFTANLVEELSADGILSNVVMPGWTLTDRVRTFFPAGIHEEIKTAFPTGRVTMPEDVASLILYLASPANGHVNGEIIRVTGKASLPFVNHLFREFMSQVST